MGPDTGPSVVREVSVFIPFLYARSPAVATTVFSPKSYGEAYAIYNIQVIEHHASSHTQIAFAASNIQNGISTDTVFHLSYVIVGDRIEAED